MTVYTKALAAVRREQMLPPASSVAVGLSGGADSVALLHLLLSLREELSLRNVTAVHINHGLRGEEAARDQRFVEELCSAWNVPLTVYTCDVAALAAEWGLGVEEAGRHVRYQQFEACADALDNGYIATAHTASDNAETVLLHLCRGSGLHGLSGIPPVRGRVVRPLIDCTREEIEVYCKQHGLSYVTDSTNVDVSYARNRIRQLVMPQLKEVNPRVETAIGRLVARAREWDRHVAAQAEDVLVAARIDENTYDRSVLLEWDTTVQGAVWRQLLGEHGEQRGSEQHISKATALLETGGRMSVPGGRELVVAGNRVSITTPPEVPFAFRFEGVVPDSEWCIGRIKWRVSCISREEYEQKLNISKNLFANACDYGKISGNLCLRGREAGDAYHPAARGCGKTLKKLFNEASLTAEQRAETPILCDEDGIVLVVGFGCDRRVCITADTEKVLMITRTEDV